MIDDISSLMRSRIRDRAGGRCEYCLLHEEDAWEPHQPDHIIARKHRGLTELENLAWTCAVCNRYKGSDVASIDSVTGRVIRLLHPRRDRWTRHFRLDGVQIVPQTSVGRVASTESNRSDPGTRGSSSQWVISTVRLNRLRLDAVHRSRSRRTDRTTPRSRQANGLGPHPLVAEPLNRNELVGRCWNNNCIPAGPSAVALGSPRQYFRQAPMVGLPR